MFIVDSHCHLDALDYENLHKNVADVVQKAKQRGVQHLLAVGVTLQRFEQVYDSLAPFPQISLACGVHPLNLEDEPFDYERLLKLAHDDKVIAIGEMGLDYYYSEENKAEQQSVFAQQIAIANELAKPIIVHTRSAREDTIALLKAHNAEKCGGILHCFTENWEMAKQALDLGFYISISGIITFKNAEALRDVVRKVPLDRLLVETDSPYLAPVPYRGKQNQPAYTREVCDYVATLKGLTSEEFAQITTQNFERLFKIQVQ
ncbi:TatD family hydrolase [Avibacterium paragallinarum]|uniref:Metal-dependent hydrolase n=1 Tax=Avibacterium paragallinarum TaxID=728 RepID=A0AAE5WIL1_AVIPA|nr:YchF/TatD family DNA exonuclease [Avibacterium paragallinarum]MEE3607641.1 YchF/TatD family DNA exonuclease [Avibacterium paragallinarum]MEE3619983.1 YchF/TatD family DNA exonuclease [Avibacterium paragallinarum]MEE3667667.1 YchF/TatD family DNA exonuclease [Avibacterium paragallinarum]MEE3679895.1 YchF/TatD family DNA exonuclease [Avibacterium paragallinarum]MEE4384800.1 YchF/TatD family DNA exonuclease [Avibacterium paragallinarum]